ncbi:hypothetical protein FCV25MIE_27203 [Fagus crenata]
MDQRTCVRHIYANFRDSDHRGKALKDKLWAAASAYTEFEFDAHMAELKKLLPPAYEYLSKIPVATWSRSKFTKKPKCDLIVNNFSECFNSYILDVRDKPILTMLDTIRMKLMRSFQVNRASIAKMSEKLCPKIQVKVDKAGVKANECLLMYSREGKYEVDYRQQNRTCPLAKKKKSKTGSKGKKKSAVTVGARTSKKGVVTVGAGTSGQAAACERLASASGATGNVGGATSNAGATGTDAAVGSGASRKAKVVVMPTVEKAMTRIAAKKQKKL